MSDSPERRELERRYEALKDEVRLLPPREQLRLAADFAEQGQVKFAVNITKLALARLEAGEQP